MPMNLDRLDLEAPASNDFETLLNEAQGWRQVAQVRTRRAARVIQQRVLEVAEFIDHCRTRPDGHYRLMEAFSTSDFALAFAWFTDYLMLGMYEQSPVVWDQFLRRTVLADFRAAARDRLQGLDTPMKEVPPGTDYKNDASLSGSRDTSLKLAKYGRKVPILWEALINDVLGELKDVPGRLARAARHTEQYTVCAAYAANSTIYTVGNGNKGTKKLSLQALQDALSAMMSQKDAGGNPIVIGMARLVVPPQLEIFADALLHANNLVYDTNPAAGTAKQRFETGNFLAPRLQLVTDYWLPILDPTNGTTGWYLFADPAVLAAGEVGFLKGHEQPELFMRKPDAVRVSASGGLSGDASPMDGDFDTDSVDYKVRHVVGASIREPKATYHSDGTVA